MYNSTRAIAPRNLPNRSSSTLLSLRQLLRLCGLLPLAQLGFDSDATKHTRNTDPLHATEAVSEPDDRDDHGQHFPCDGDGDQEQRAEDGKRVDW